MLDCIACDGKVCVYASFYPRITEISLRLRIERLGFTSKLPDATVHTFHKPASKQRKLPKKCLSQGHYNVTIDRCKLTIIVATNVAATSFTVCPLLDPQCVSITGNCKTGLNTSCPMCSYKSFFHVRNQLQHFSVLLF